MDINLVLFGGFTAQRPDGSVIELPTRKAEALLAYLACRAGEAQPRDRLTALLWGERADAQARHSLSQTLTSIRRALNGAASMLNVDRDAVTLRPCTAAIDIAGFKRLASSDSPEDLRSAAELYRGPFLDGFKLRDSAFEEWLQQERAALYESAVTVLLKLAKALKAANDTAGAVAALNRAIKLDPLAEEAYRQRMRLELEQGAFNGVIRHYRQCADVLRRELNTSPEPSTTAIYREAMDRLSSESSPDLTAELVLKNAGLPEANVLAAEALSAQLRRKASLAVMPFIDDTAEHQERGGMADGLAHDIITRLAKLRSLFVIARGTVFALRESHVSPEVAGRMLKVDYIASGSMRQRNGRIIVTAELAEASTSRILWTEVFDRTLDDAFLVLEEIGNQIVAAIAKEIESTECSKAILKPPNSLDAWGAYHRGLWHMYRFTKTDNDAARHFFEMATQLDPAFSRPYAGLSFTHFQNVFLHRTPERDREIDRAYRAASQSLFIDEQDPAAHWAMGRAQWLRGCEEESLRELDLSVQLSPNFALGHYTLAFVHCQSGDPQAAVGFADYSRRLSPFDPMLFGMLATRALGLVRLGQFEEAADWATKAAARPNAHAHILGITANCLAAAGRFEEARTFTAAIHETLPRYGIEDFLAALRFAPDAASLFRKNAGSIGLA